MVSGFIRPLHSNHLALESSDGGCCGVVEIFILNGGEWEIGFQWRALGREDYKASDSNPYDYSFTVLERKD